MLALQEESFAQKLANTALNDAGAELGYNDNTNFGEKEIAEVYERAILKLSMYEGEITRAKLHLTWVFARDGLFAQRGDYTSLRDWALAKQSVLRETWSESTIQRYVAAVERVLMPLNASPVTDPETGEIITPETLIESSAISALVDYAYTYSIAQDDQQREAIILSIHRHDNDVTRDNMIRLIKSGKLPEPIKVHVEYGGDTVQFSGETSYERWKAFTAFNGSMLEEHLT